MLNRLKVINDTIMMRRKFRKFLFFYFISFRLHCVAQRFHFHDLSSNCTLFTRVGAVEACCRGHSCAAHEWFERERPSGVRAHYRVRVFASNVLECARRHCWLPRGSGGRSSVCTPPQARLPLEWPPDAWEAPSPASARCCSVAWGSLLVGQEGQCPP